ncbi:MAG: acyl carrier protein [Atopobiaceae bacterium]|uniref:Acyl carrier protein n=1 Tax=Olsenella absiana TaxID=3115222 RepID=A0ABU7R826_9ACTN|nr:acyl carrier protein [Olsenella sp.]MDD7364214.1 acyl carrier protein [Olsenella sp.]MDY3901255.1 acyl carrier protein [Atopobiaceae bacterium]
MDRAAILEKVRDLVSETLECDRDSVEEGTRFSDLGADSFDLLELVTAFEDEFGKTLDDDALQGIETVKDAVDAIENAQ